jgi:hypothetical protein
MAARWSAGCVCCGDTATSRPKPGRHSRAHHQGEGISKGWPQFRVRRTQRCGGVTQSCAPIDAKPAWNRASAGGIGRSSVARSQEKTRRANSRTAISWDGLNAFTRALRPSNKNSGARITCGKLTGGSPIRRRHRKATDDASYGRIRGMSRAASRIRQARCGRSISRRLRRDICGGRTALARVTTRRISSASDAKRCVGRSGGDA